VGPPVGHFPLLSNWPSAMFHAKLESGNQCHLLPYATNNAIICLLAYVMKLELFGITPPLANFPT
jgi:hypothetical protein